MSFSLRDLGNFGHGGMSHIVWVCRYCLSQARGQDGNNAANSVMSVMQHYGGEGAKGGL